MWPCASVSPGMGRPPPRSTIFGATALREQVSREPAQASLPSRRRTVSTVGVAGSSVWILPTTSTSAVVGAGLGPRDAHATAAASRTNRIARGYRDTAAVSTQWRVAAFSAPLLPFTLENESTSSDALASKR